jgi:hypothetical protein
MVGLPHVRSASIRGILMSITRRLGALVCAAVVGVGLAVVAVSPAEAALRTCNSETNAQSRRDPSLYVFTPFWFDSSVNWTGSFKCQLKQGNTGNGVRRLQQSLNWCYGYHLTEDGIFGPNTRNALVGMQRRVGTSADGIYGPNTRAAMKHFGDIFTRNCEYVVAAPY